MATYNITGNKVYLGKSVLNQYDNKLTSSQPGIHLDNANTTLLSLEKHVIEDTGSFTGTGNYLYNNKKIYEILNEIPPELASLNTDAKWHVRCTWDQLTYNFKYNDGTGAYWNPQDQSPSVTQDGYVDIEKYNPNIWIDIVPDEYKFDYEYRKEYNINWQQLWRDTADNTASYMRFLSSAQKIQGILWYWGMDINPDMATTVVAGGDTTDHQLEAGHPWTWARDLAESYNFKPYGWKRVGIMPYTQQGWRDATNNYYGSLTAENKLKTYDLFLDPPDNSFYPIMDFIKAINGDYGNACVPRYYRKRINGVTTYECKKTSGGAISRWGKSGTYDSNGATWYVWDWVWDEVVLFTGAQIKALMAACKNKNGASGITNEFYIPTIFDAINPKEYSSFIPSGANTGMMANIMMVAALF